MEIDWPARTLWHSYDRRADWTGPPSWMGSLLQHARDNSGQLYRRNRYYDPSTGVFTQEDPIGLAGGINLYGFADGDPVTYSDPYGLKVCYKGTRSQIQRLKSGTEQATGTSITLDTDNCISALEMPTSDHALSPLAWRLAHLAFMIDDHTVEVAFGTRPNGGALRQSYAWVENPQYPAGRKGVTIGNAYGEAGYRARGRFGTCPRFGKVTPTLGSVIAHELLGHSYGQSLNGFRAASGEPYAIATGNIYEQAVGMPTRCAH